MSFKMSELFHWAPWRYTHLHALRSSRPLFFSLFFQHFGSLESSVTLDKTDVAGEDVIRSFKSAACV